jgi:hypothetical protein
MNVYKRLQKCRVELGMMEIKESGNNKFAGYTYMELGDFLPHITGLCELHGLCTVISFDDKATLTIINSDKPEEQIVVTSPMSTAELKGCHAIQNLGAVETYLRRYLYVAAFDIVEHDALDSTHGKDPVQSKSEDKTTTTSSTGDCISEAQGRMVFAKLKSKNLAPSDLKEKFGIEDTKLVKKTQINDVMAWIDGK